MLFARPALVAAVAAAICATASASVDAQAKFGVRLSLRPAAPLVREPATLTLRAFWEDGRPLRDGYPFKVLAVAPGVDFFAALGSLSRPTSSLGPRDRFLIVMRHASSGTWHGRFTVPRRGRWRLVVVNFVGADRRIPAVAQLAFRARNRAVAGGHG